MAATPTQQFTNNAATTLAADITNSATTVVLAPGSGALFPALGSNEYFMMTFTDASTQTQIEIVKATAITGDTVTIVRGQEGTTHRAWVTSDLAQLRATAGTLENFPQPPQMLLQAGDFALDTGTTNAMVISTGATQTNFAALAGTPLRITKGANSNTGPVTLAVNGAAAKPVVDLYGNPLAAGAIPGNSTAIYVYDNTVYNSFIFQSAASATPAGVRTQLSANLNLYVSTTGSDSNSGLGSGTAWLTLQHAWDVVFASYDFNGHSITVNIADGTYANGVSANGRLLGAATTGSLKFLATGSSSTCIVSQASGNVFSASDGAEYLLQNVGLVASGGNAINAGWGGRINQSGCAFGLCTGAHQSTQNGGRITLAGSYTVIGSATSHLLSTNNAGIDASGSLTVALSSTPAFSSAFAKAQDGSVLNIDSGNVTFTGSATGVRYSATLNAVIDTSGGGGSYFPGNSAGSTATGGQYA